MLILLLYFYAKEGDSILKSASYFIKKLLKMGLYPLK